LSSAGGVIGLAGFMTLVTPPSLISLPAQSPALAGGTATGRSSRKQRAKRAVGRDILVIIDSMAGGFASG
jgi:hypothetical protein